MTEVVLHERQNLICQTPPVTLLWIVTAYLESPGSPAVVGRNAGRD
jgi:hypothetical protein